MLFGEPNPNVIFVVNDPLCIKPDLSVKKSKRKPDIILIKKCRYVTWLKNSDHYTFEDCTDSIVKDELHNNGRVNITAENKASWSDVHLFCELKKSSEIEVAPLHAKYNSEFTTESPPGQI